MCNKESYLTHDLARAAAQGIGKRHKGSVKVYRCHQCGYLHLASEAKKKLNKQPPNFRM